MDTPPSHGPRFWSAREDGAIQCELCPRTCAIRDGHSGVCGVRKNQGGTLLPLTFGRPAAVHVDPIEKKPLFHFLPGSTVLSLGAAGCNLTCSFCQNWSLSRARPDDLPAGDLPPDAVVALALRRRTPSIAFTYNEPTVWAEYVIETAAIARARGLRTVMVTNGYVRREVVPELYRDIDAANVDLKAFSDDFYRSYTGGRLAPVLDAIVAIAATGTHVELTTLLIPGLNDDPAAIAEEARWVMSNLGPDTPLHFSAFHPDHRMTDRPRTPPATLSEARRLAMEAGLRYVYEGNVASDGCDTYCPGCGRAVIRRRWNEVTAFDLDAADRCRCGGRVPIRR